MSFMTANPIETVKKQFAFKMRGNIDAFSSLMGIQLLGLFFSVIGGIGSVGSLSSRMMFEAKYYSADLVIFFSIIWGFVTAITITTKPYRNHDFTYITNRVTSSVANILFLLTASCIAGLTAMLSKYLLFLAHNLLFSQPFYGSVSSGKEFFIGLVATILYIFWASSIGYLIGTFVQVNRMFAFLIPVLFFGVLFLDFIMKSEPFSQNLLMFYTMEPSFILFSLKTVITTILLFLASISILNRMEVRK
ncbi:hypothetical protein KDN24_24965 [Bacillus sp. Bva_UNVM-123]|uniref:hypothetical protein n=1 Tax=Bacillus sp. Bva_UNVM-123 TaxID=2829798 RepID=UPI00391F9C12